MQVGARGAVGWLQRGLDRSTWSDVSTCQDFRAIAQSDLMVRIQDPDVLGAECLRDQQVGIIIYRDVRCADAEDGADLIVAGECDAAAGNREQGTDSHRAGFVEVVGGNGAQRAGSQRAGD